VPVVQLLEGPRLPLSQPGDEVAVGQGGGHTLT
jgi:hypothetical protein